jgi:hypothetical protein
VLANTYRALAAIDESLLGTAGLKAAIDARDPDMWDRTVVIWTADNSNIHGEHKYDGKSLPVHGGDPVLAVCPLARRPTPAPTRRWSPTSTTRRRSARSPAPRPGCHRTGWTCAASSKAN